MFYYAMVFMSALTAAGLFYAGLWLTTRRLLTSRYAAVWAISSFLIRSAVLLLAFYALGGTDPAAWLICTAAMPVARMIIGRWSRKGGKPCA